jgi:hypothetical protein
MYDNVRARLSVRHDAPNAHVPDAPHSFRAKIKDQVVPFELWPRRVVVKMSYHGPVPTKSHPTQSHARPDYPAARTYMKRFRRSMSLLSPVHADVWLRLVLRMIPVNSRFMYRQEVDPDSPMCSHGCGVHETERHAFHDCTKVLRVWDTHSAAWQATGATFSWHSLLNIDCFDVHPSWLSHKPALFQLWVMLVGVTLHLVWTHHNMVLYQGRRMPPPHVLMELSFILWMTTCRRHLRLIQASRDEVEAALTALHLLLRQPHYRDLRAKHPRCLALESTFDVH